MCGHRPAPNHAEAEHAEKAVRGDTTGGTGSGASPITHFRSGFRSTALQCDGDRRVGPGVPSLMFFSVVCKRSRPLPVGRERSPF